MVAVVIGQEGKDMLGDDSDVNLSRLSRTQCFGHGQIGEHFYFLMLTTFHLSPRKSNNAFIIFFDTLATIAVQSELYLDMGLYI